MTADAGNLKSLTPYFGFNKIYVGDASLTPSSGNYELKDVLFVPDINLISFSKLIEKNSCIFEFSLDKFWIKDPEDRMDSGNRE